MLLKTKTKTWFVLRYTPNNNNFSHYHPQVCCDASRQSGVGFRWSMWCFAHGSWRQQHACLCRRLWPPLQAAAVSAGPRWLQKERRKCFKIFIIHSQNTINKYSTYEFCCLGCSWTIFQWTELFLSCQHFSVQCCFMSTETIRLIRNGEPRTATSTFTQLLSSDLVRCYFASIYRFVRSASLSGWSCLTPGDTWISYKSHFRTEAPPQMVRCM